MGSGRCEADGCGRFVRAGMRHCRRHAGAGSDSDADADSDADRGGWGEEEEASELFRRRLAAGEYRGLYGPELAAVLAEAGAERGLDDEIGALRVTLARLLVEERDPSRLAAAVARVAGIAVQAARVRQAMGGESAPSLGGLLARLLVEDGECRMPSAE